MYILLGDVPAIRAVWAGFADPGDWWWKGDGVWARERPKKKGIEGLQIVEVNFESPWVESFLVERNDMSDVEDVGESSAHWGMTSEYSRLHGKGCKIHN